MGCDRCAKRLVCLCPWRRTVEGHALTGPLRSVRTYPRPLPLQSQRADCGRPGGCSGGSVAAAPQKSPRPDPKRPPEPGILHLSLTSGTVSGPRAGARQRRAGIACRFRAAFSPWRRHHPARFGAAPARLPWRRPTGCAARRHDVPCPPGCYPSPPGIGWTSSGQRAGPALFDAADSPEALADPIGGGTSHRPAQAALTGSGRGAPQDRRKPPARIAATRPPSPGIAPCGCAAECSRGPPSGEGRGEAAIAIAPRAVRHPERNVSSVTGPERRRQGGPRPL